LLKNIYILLSISLISVFLAANVYAADSPSKPFTLYAFQTENTQEGNWLARVYQDLFTRINIPLEIIYVSPSRISVDAELGKADGQFTRIFSYQDKHPSQIRINVPIAQNKMVTYTRRDLNYQFDSQWDSFRRSSLKVEYLRGIFFSQQHLEKVVLPSHLFEITDIRRALRKLTHKRTDVFVHAYSAVHQFLKEDEFKDDIIAASDLEVFKMYLYVNIKYIELVPLLEKTLYKMKKEGVIDKYCRAAFAVDADLVCS